MMTLFVRASLLHYCAGQEADPVKLFHLLENRIEENRIERNRRVRFG